MKDWRGDKSYFRHCLDKSDDKSKERNSKRYMIIPQSSLAPDLTLKARESGNVWDAGTEIYVECKWTQKGKFYLKKNSIKHYDDFLKEALPNFTYTARLERLFFVFGVGWDTIKGQPKKAYCVRANSLYKKLNNESIMSLEYGWQGNRAKGKDALIIHYGTFKDIGGIELIKDSGRIDIYYK